MPRPIKMRQRQADGQLVVDEWPERAELALSQLESPHVSTAVKIHVPNGRAEYQVVSVDEAGGCLVLQLIHGTLAKSG